MRFLTYAAVTELFISCLLSLVIRSTMTTPLAFTHVLWPMIDSHRASGAIFMCSWYVYLRITFLRWLKIHPHSGTINMGDMEPFQGPKQSIYRLNSITHTGEPITAQWICWWKHLFNMKLVHFKQFSKTFGNIATKRWYYRFNSVHISRPRFWEI